MANHAHKQIRDALVTRLTGLTTSGARVYDNRLMAMADANLPGLRISMDEERSENATAEAPARQLREVSVVVECCAKAASGLDDTLDQMAKEVEIAMATALTVALKPLIFEYAGSTYTDEQLDKPVGIKQLRYITRYSAAEGAPDVLI